MARRLPLGHGSVLASCCVYTFLLLLLRLAPSDGASENIWRAVREHQSVRQHCFSYNVTNNTIGRSTNH